MAFFNQAITVLQTLVIALGAGLGIWGVINLLEGYGNDNPGAKSQGMKQLMAGAGVAIVGMVLVCMFPANPVPWFAVVGVLFVAFVRPVNSVPSLVLPELFGRKDYNRINSLGMAGYYLGATISSFLVAWISEISGSYTNSYMCLAVIALISFVLFFVAIRLSPYRREQHAAKKS